MPTNESTHIFSNRVRFVKCAGILVVMAALVLLTWYYLLNGRYWIMAHRLGGLQREYWQTKDRSVQDELRSDIMGLRCYLIEQGYLAGRLVVSYSLTDEGWEDLKEFHRKGSCPCRDLQLADSNIWMCDRPARILKMLEIIEFSLPHEVRSAWAEAPGQLWAGDFWGPAPQPSNTQHAVIIELGPIEELEDIEEETNKMPRHVP